MGNLLSGLEALGLKNLGDMEIFGKKEEEKQPKKGAAAKAAEIPVDEKDLLFEKAVDCPVCDSKFKTKVVKSTIRPLMPDMDLRPKYQNIDPLKYDVISCPNCGYTALSRYFSGIVSIQRARVKEKICANFTPKVDDKEIYSYEDAQDRYKLALVNAVVKGAKDSEKAYICLKSAWIQRGKAELLGEGHPEFIVTKELEADYMRNAYDGFVQALAQESFPMCGMDEQTVNYLVSVLALNTNHLDVASRFVATILTSQVASSRIKDKARNVKEEIIKRKKALEEFDE